jgi:hypothetical protein
MANSSNIYDAIDPPKPTSSAPTATPQVNPYDVIDPPPGPNWRDSWWAKDTAAGAALGARTGIRVLSALPNLAVGAGNLGGWGISKLTGLPFTPQPMPSEDIIHNISNISGKPLEMAPNASLPMKVADFGLPFLFMSGGGGSNVISRMQEASGPLNKTAELAGHVAGATADAGLSYLGGILGDKYIGGPEGAFVGSLFGGGIRPATQRGFGWELSNPEEGGKVFDQMTNPVGPNTMPTAGQVGGPGVKQVEAAAGAIPVLGAGVNAARRQAKAGINDAIGTGVSEVGGDRAPSAAPAEPGATAGRIIDLSREANASQQDALSAQQDALENAIGPDRPTRVSPLVDTISGMANRGPGPISRVMNPRVDDLYGTLNLAPGDNYVAMHPDEGYAPELTAPYSDLKILRTDLGQKTVTTDPVKGPAYDQAYGAYTDAMRGAAEEAGQGPAFDQANFDYHTFKQVNQPWLEKQGGGLKPNDTRPSPTTIASRVNGIQDAKSPYLTEIESQLGPDAARSTAADVLSRMGDRAKGGENVPSQWGNQYATLPEAVKQFIADQSPTGAQRLENAAAGGRAIDIQPERSGLSNRMGGLATMLGAIAAHPAVAGVLGAGIETPSVIRALAGRTDLPAILAQYARRQGVAAGLRGQ